MARNDWIAPENVTLPDFIIYGAMKAGTSTLHYILNEHPNVYIPSGELHFFDIDNILEHPDFNYFDGSNWVRQRIEDDPMLYWKWYSSHFGGARVDQIVGEDSTTYLASTVAAKRIQWQNKRIKLIVLLRHPTSRAYSQYWHMLRSGRATHSFEDTIRFDPYSILHSSLYFEQLERLFFYVPQDQIKVVIFEEFIKNKNESLREVCAHIGVDYNLLPKHSIDSHKNKGLIPKYPAIQVFKNRLFREAGNIAYHAHLPMKPNLASFERMKIGNMRLINKLHGKLNPLIDRKPLAIKPTTKTLLDDLFKRELEGIDNLLGKDVMSIWFG